MNLSPDLNFIEPMHNAFTTYGPMFEPDEPNSVGAGETYRSGHVNFLEEAIRMLYLAGRENEAAHYYNYLQTTYRLTINNRPNPAYLKTLDNFVLDSFKAAMDAAGPREMGILLTGFLMNGWEELAQGDVQRWTRIVQRAREWHAYYMKDKKDDLMLQRQWLPPFPDMVLDTLRAWLASDERVAVSPQLTLIKSRLWRSLPLFLRQGVYDDVLTRLTDECDRFGYDVARVFPEPRGMAEIREERKAREAPGREPTAETPEQSMNQ
jgi:hypothetical protein